MNKSILKSAITGFPTEDKPLQENPIITINIPEKPHIQERKLEIIELEKKEPEQKKTVVINIPQVTIKNTIIPELIRALGQSKNCSSILDSIDSGFGPEQTITIPNCPKPKHYTHLYKENYLSEFKTEQDKKQARDNLGVYSKDYIDQLVSTIVINNEKFVTKEYLSQQLQNLDFVDSVIKAYANYQIPDSLFKL